MPALPPPVTSLLAEQDGVVSRRQLIGLGATGSDLRCWLRHRLLVTVHPGVYVDHTGEPTWCQRAWAAVLYAAPAALAGTSSLLATLGASRQLDARAPIAVEVEHGRTLEPPEGVVIGQTRHLDARVQWNRRPPRVRLEEAALDVAGAADDDLATFAVLAEVVCARRTTAARLAETLGRRHRQRRRRILAAVVADLDEGACSVLERAYLRDVERAHGLPRAGRQVRASSRGAIFRDVLYRAFGVVIELDGRADHTRLHDRDRDLDRDLDAVVDGLVTARLGHGQVLGRPCATAVRVGRILQQRGWTGEPHPCPRCA
ncbi:hypothetical protein [Nocardioides sp. CFH 31398]|uniref:hypothetical protein n=1 Tax=Nocardioides sp. CFH 31398 TaxID=2919579 RepID=UPI001F06BD43|nr:hypothetical protein [Nocardioides sp. CFH 31398]MCH1866185.1 hypothetical protein [Nocardioides sp. CFH 31398]